MISINVNMEKDKYNISVIGFSRYLFNEKDLSYYDTLKEIEHPLTKNENGKYKTCFFLSDEGKRIYTTPMRMVYCGMKGIDPFMIVGSGKRFDFINGKIVVNDFSTFSRTRLRVHEPMDIDSIIQRYEESKRFMDSVIDFYRSGSDEGMTEIIMKCKRPVVYLLRKRVCISMENANISFDVAADRCISDIQERRCVIHNPFNYLYKQAYDVVKVNSKKKTIIENINYE